MSLHRNYYIIPSLRSEFGGRDIMDQEALIWLQNQPETVGESTNLNQEVSHNKDEWITRQLTRAIPISSSELYGIYDEFEFIASSISPGLKVPDLDLIFVQRYQTDPTQLNFRLEFFRLIQNGP